jgi:uncharacterized protein (TIGR02001 family)
MARALGGTFNASFTATSEYSYAGISNTARQPAAQMNVDYRSADLMQTPQTWFYLSSFLSNVVLPAGPGAEVDAICGVKFRLSERLRLDLGLSASPIPASRAISATTTEISM